MKIVLISNMYPSKNFPNYGVFVKNFEDGITKNNIVVHKSVIKGKGGSKIGKVFKYVKFFYDVYRQLIKNKYDLIYVHYIGHSLLPLVIVKKLIKKPLVINAHGSDVFSISKVGVLIQKLVSPIVRKADLIVVPSGFFEEEISEKFLISKSKIFISPSGGIDMSLFKSLSVKNSMQVFTIGLVSRIDEGKGWDILLLAILELRSRIAIAFRVIVIGGGSKESELVEMRDALNLKEVVSYLGPVPHNELVSHYNGFDLFVFPTTFKESLGLVGLEAMACGVPVVGSNIGGLKSYIKSGFNGDLFEPGNHLALAESISEYMLLDDNIKDTYRVNALNTAKDYDSRSVAKKISEKLEELI